MSEERTYYVAGGEDLSKALEFIEARKASLQAMGDVAKKFGGQAVHQGGVIAGLMLDEQPAGWSLKGTYEGNPFYFPKKINKDLKAAASELRAVRLKGAREFHRLFSEDGGELKPNDSGGFGMRILYIVWEWVGETLLLSVPVGCDFKPNGSTSLKMSEYWAMKEATPYAEPGHD